jgi:WS/DGAT/MGAT family acyltransferase
MTSVDRSWLLADGPKNRMVINGLWIFTEPLDHERFVRTLAERFLTIRRFRQRVVEPPGAIGRAYWEDDPNFDLRAHIRRIALPAPGTKETLQELVSSLVSTPLDQSKPLWEFYLIEDYEGGSALLGRLHHCLADGVALVQVMLSLTDPTPDDSWQPSSKRRRTGWNPVRSMLRTARSAIDTSLGLGSALVEEGIESLAKPARLLDRAEEGATLAGKAAGVLGKLLFMSGDDRTIFKGKLGVTKSVAWSEGVPLDEVKFIKERTGTTVNDVLVSVLTGALRKYMLSRGDNPSGKEIRAMVPVNVRSSTQQIDMGNQFALVYLALPVGIADPLDRLFEVKRRMDFIKQSPEAMITYQIIAGLGLFPNDMAGLVKEYFASKASTILTNVPGPPKKLYFAGTPLDKMYFWVPQSGSIGMGLSILSYGGEVTIGVMTDDGIVPDPAGIVHAFGAEFAALRDIAHLPDEEATKRRSDQEDNEAATRRGDEADEAVHNPAEVIEALMAEYLALKAAEGLLDVIAPPAEIAEETQRCQGSTKSGERCKRRAKPGSVYCQLHQRDR